MPMLIMPMLVVAVLVVAVLVVAVLVVIATISRIGFAIGTDGFIGLAIRMNRVTVM